MRQRRNPQLRQNKRTKVGLACFTWAIWVRNLMRDSTETWTVKVWVYTYFYLTWLLSVVQANVNVRYQILFYFRIFFIYSWLGKTKTINKNNWKWWSKCQTDVFLYLVAGCQSKEQTYVQSRSILCFFRSFYFCLVSVIVARQTTQWWMSIKLEPKQLWPAPVRTPSASIQSLHGTASQQCLGQNYQLVIFSSVWLSW